MKSLSQLRDKAQLALAKRELVQVAENFSPTAAYERAIALYYSEEMARSCRFLAIIYRDYGKDAVENLIRDKREADLDRFFKERVVPGISLLETVGGGKLMIVDPQDCDLPLLDYLERSKVHSLDVGMTLGEYRIAFKWQIKKDSKHNDTECRLVVIGPDGKNLEYTDSDNKVYTEQSFTMMCGKRHHPDSVNLRSELYHAIERLLYGNVEWPHQSVMLLIIADLEKRGCKMAPRLQQYCKDRGLELWKLNEYGLVGQLKQFAMDLRGKAVADGVCPQGLAFLDLQIDRAISEATLYNEVFDMGTLLVSKLHNVHFWVDYHVIPGPRAEKTYNFLLHTDSGMGDWVTLLEKKGYGGSVVIAFFNIHSGMQVARTGQCDALLLQQHGGCQKDDILAEAQSSMEIAQAARGNTKVSKLPRYKWDSHHSGSHQTCGGFDKFLDEYFPK